MRRKKTKAAAVTAVVLGVIVLTVWFLSGRTGKAVHAKSDLAGAVVGVQLGTSADVIVTQMEAGGKGTQVERFTKTADAVQALLQGKIDCVVEDELPAREFARKNDNLQILGEVLESQSMALCVAKKNTTLKARIDSALAVLQANGTLADIISRHIDKDEAVAYRPAEGTRRKGTLVVATNATFPPYEYYEQGRLVGIDIDLMHAVADLLGMDVRLEDMNFDAVITSVQTGKADVGAAGLTISEERKKNVSFSTPYTAVRTVIIVRNSEAAATKGFVEKLHDDFIAGERYVYLFKGLGNTLLITFFATILSLLLGTVVAIIRSTHDTTGRLRWANAFCQVYLAVLRGTPTMVQLLIIYYVVFASVDVSKVFVAVVAFGINSSAYLAEVVRGGIMAVDRGQTEAGRSLGLTHWQTMRLVVLPQAFKNVLPAIGNEMITLLKETSIAGYIGIVDLTKGSDIIRSITYDAMLPLTTVAVIYFAIVCLMALAVSRLEKKLRKNERKQ